MERTIDTYSDKEIDDAHFIFRRAHQTNQLENPKPSRKLTKQDDDFVRAKTWDALCALDDIRVRLNELYPGKEYLTGASLILALHYTSEIEI